MRKANYVDKYKIAEIKDVPKNEMRVFNVKGQEILVVNVEGELYAFNNQCPHLEYPLFFGSLENAVLTCGFHGAKFNIRTGKSLGPVTNKPLKTIQVKIHNSSIFIKV